MEKLLKDKDLQNVTGGEKDLRQQILDVISYFMEDAAEVVGQEEAQDYSLQERLNFLWTAVYFDSEDDIRRNLNGIHDYFNDRGWLSPTFEYHYNTALNLLNQF
ncbi:MAG: hypothetical protein MJ236_03505 [Clostridia bacterium]|nr:hypothetical protein [Clostridia bacterium]